MRWKLVFPKAKPQQTAVENGQGRIGAADHASPSTTTISNDNQPISSPSPQTNTSFSSLPFDLFISVLQLAISVESEFSPTYDIRVLHVVNAVCRHWRWTALNSPSVWAYIPSYLPLNVFQLFLQRSANALLHVDLVYEGYFGHQSNPRMDKDGPSPEVRFLAKLGQDSLAPP